MTTYIMNNKGDNTINLPNMLQEQDILIFNYYNDGQLNWIVPNTGTYHIKAYGAKGGGTLPGLGSIVEGNIFLKAGQKLSFNIYSAGQGGGIGGTGGFKSTTGGNDGKAGGNGGGATKVYLDNSLIIAAAGGGGSGGAGGGGTAAGAGANADSNKNGGNGSTGANQRSFGGTGGLGGTSTSPFGKGGGGGRAYNYQATNGGNGQSPLTTFDGAGGGGGGGSSSYTPPGGNNYWANGGGGGGGYGGISFIDENLSNDFNITSTNNGDGLVEITVLSIETKKYLFKDGNNIKKWVKGDPLTPEVPSGWQIVGTAPATKAMFDSDGMTDLSAIDNEAIQQLTSDTPELLCWTNDEENSNSRQINFTAVPLPQLLIPVEDIIIGKIESVNLSSIISGIGDIKIIVSGDSGITWKGKTEIDTTNLIDVKTNGYTPDELNNLTKTELEMLFPNNKARFAFYLEQEKSSDTVQINTLKINEKIYTVSPLISNLSVLYDLLKTKQPKYFVSRDNGVTWKEIEPDTLVDITDLPEGNQLRIKIQLSNGQELYGLSYSWI